MTLATITSYLKQFNYPNFYGMNETEIENIFSVSNRDFLISWIFTQIDKDYAEPIKQFSSDDFANLIWCHGFCDACDKSNFMTGNISKELQDEIFLKMFTHLEIISAAKTISSKDSVLSNQDCVKDLLDVDLNLFKVYGPQQSLTAAQRMANIKGYYKEIEHLRSIIDSKNLNDSKDLPLPEEDLKKKLEIAINSFDDNMTGFRRAVLDLPDKNEEAIEEQAVGFSEDCAAIIEKCKVNSAMILQFFNDMNFLTNVRGDMLDLKENNNVYTRGIRQLAELCTEISSMSK